MIRYFWISLLTIFLTIGRPFYAEMIGQAVLGAALGAATAEGVRRMASGYVNGNAGRFLLALLLIAGYSVHLYIVYTYAIRVNWFGIIFLALCSFIWWGFRIMDELAEKNPDSNTLPSEE